MMVIPSGSTILAPALSAAITACVCSSREAPLVSSPATTQIFFTPELLGDRHRAPDLFLEFLALCRVGIGDPVAESLDRRRRELSRNQPELAVQRHDRVDILVPPRPEFVVRKPASFTFRSRSRNGSLPQVISTLTA